MRVLAVLGVSIVAGSVSFASLAMAQTAAADVCARLAAAVSTNTRNLAYIHARGFLDRSAAQGTERASEEGAILALLKVNLDLMAANRCPMPTTPITRGGYMDGAAACASSSGDGAQIRAACSGWRFDETAPEPSASAGTN